MAVSSDGVVTATVDSATASILLTVDFTVAGSPVASGVRSSITEVAVTELGAGRGVRGLYKGSAPGGFVVGIDHEAPFTAGLSYRAVAYNGLGVALGTSASVAINLPAPAATAATWLKSLGTPSASVNAFTKTIPEWSSDIASSAIRVMGRPDPIVIQDVRQFETGTLALLTRTAAEEDRLRALLQIPGPYFLQMPTFGEDDCYVSVGQYSRSRVANNAGSLERIWSLPLTQVARPAVAGWQVAIPGHTYADSQVRWPLYSNRTGTYNLRATT